VYGAGPAIVLVDGATATRAFSGSTELAQALAERGFTTYAFDRRTRGESGDTQPYTVAREIEDIEALIDQAGGNANLYGISSGGALALEAAAALGYKVRKIAVYEIPYMGVDPARVPAPEVFTQTKQAVKDGRNGDAFAAYMGQWIPEEMLAGLRQAPFWPMMEGVASSLVNDATIMFGRKFTPRKSCWRRSPCRCWLSRETWTCCQASILHFLPRLPRQSPTWCNRAHLTPQRPKPRCGRRGHCSCAG